MSAVVLEAKNLTRKLTGEVPVTLVDNANLAIREGECTSIVGPSGSGKSSLLYLLGLLDKPTSGSVLLNGLDTSGSSEEELARIRLAEMGFVFQSHFLLPEFTAIENVMLPMKRLGALSEHEIHKQATSVLVSLGLEDKLDKLPRQLSGGQSQRVAIARALANNPKLILADEPTGNLDSASSLNVQKILKSLARDGGKAVLIVTHDPAFAESTDRIVTIVDGKITRQ